MLLLIVNHVLVNHHTNYCIILVCIWYVILKALQLEGFAFTSFAAISLLVIAGQAWCNKNRMSSSCEVGGAPLGGFTESESESVTINLYFL